MDWRLPRLVRYWLRLLHAPATQRAADRAPTHANAIGFQEGPSLPAADFLFEADNDLIAMAHHLVQIRNTRIEFGMPVFRNRARLILAAARCDNLHIVFGRGSGRKEALPKV